MLAHWRIKNFKSFGDEPDLKLTKINVLAGANSSGKSSIIQSILLLKQTLQYGAENRSITLNGPLLRLGSFADVLNNSSSDGTIELGFDIELSSIDFRRYPQGAWMRTLNRLRTGTELVPIRTISLQLKWQKIEEGDALFGGDTQARQNRTPQLVSTCMEATRPIADGEEKLHTRLVRKYPKDTESEDLSGWDFSVELDEATKQEMFRDRPDASIAGGYLSFFLPHWITVRFNRTAQDAIRLATALCSRDTFAVTHNVGGEELPIAVLPIVNDWLQKRQRPTIEAGGQAIAASVVRDAIKNALPQQSFFLESTASRLLLGNPSNEDTASMVKLKEQITSLLLSSSPAVFDIDFDLPRTNADISNFIKDFFKQGVRYLGPLRDSPRPVYQVEALESTTDVGYRGEHTAAILDLNAGLTISYIKPPTEADDASWPGSTRLTRASLHDAVVEWLNYLGVATEVRTADAGVFGHQLQVTTYSAGKLHDLTNVGVGVSQVLPIVVMALLSSPGSLLIFEQPELHLHPRVQARLADFFIALAREEKQVLLETHSEYLVDRFRLRIAQSTNDELLSTISILFSEKVGGTSRLTPVLVNEFGGVANWPADFFEQSQKDISQIIHAASEKRRVRRPK